MRKRADLPIVEGDIALNRRVSCPKGHAGPRSQRARRARAFLHVPCAVLLLGYSNSDSDLVIDPALHRTTPYSKSLLPRGLFLPDWGSWRGCLNGRWGDR